MTFEKLPPRATHRWRESRVVHLAVVLDLAGGPSGLGLPGHPCDVGHEPRVFIGERSSPEAVDHESPLIGHGVGKSILRPCRWHGVGTSE